MARDVDLSVSRRSFLGAVVATGATTLAGPLLSGCGHDDGSPPVIVPASTDPEATAWDTVATAILARIKPPTFPDRDFPITAFGAVAGATATDATVVANTQAINNAIVAANLAGGGRVLVPSGTFMTGAIRLRSNVNLYLQNAG